MKGKLANIFKNINEELVSEMQEISCLPKTLFIS